MRDQLLPNETMDGSRPRDGRGVEDPAVGLALSVAQMQVLDALQGTMVKYLPQFGHMGTRAVVIEAIEQAGLVKPLVTQSITRRCPCDIKPLVTQSIHNIFAVCLITR